MTEALRSQAISAATFFKRRSKSLSLRAQGGQGIRAATLGL
jgi:hypothetical protein